MKITGDVKKGIERVKKLVSGLPETTCSSRGICCRAGCPNMTVGEYLRIHHEHVEKLTKEERIELIVKCVKLYIEPQDPTGWRPCPLLSEDMKCEAYLARPFRCRTYGLIPNDLYRNMVERVEKETKVAATNMPLCIQCQLVKVKPEFEEQFPGGVIPENMIKKIESQLRENDRELGIEEDTQEEGFSYLTFHDWHLLFSVGEKIMSYLTQLRLSKDKSSKERFIVLLKEQIAGSVK